MAYEIKSIEGFREISQLKNVVLFHFWAEWNGTDYLMKKLLAELEQELAKKVTFASVDVDNEKMYDFFRNIPIVNVPTLIYYKNRDKISIDIGFDTKQLTKEKEKISQKLKSLFDFDE